MRRVQVSALCAIIAVSLPAFAAPPPAASAPPKGKGAAPATAPLERALDAWGRGEWTDVRDILEPLVRDGGQLETEQQTEAALRYLADATLLDESLDAKVRRELATEYLERLLDMDLQWTPPPDTHSPELEALAEEVRAARREKIAENCAIERTTCQADLQELRKAHDDLTLSYEQLDAEHDAQNVLVRDLATKNRAVALVPFGVGHFYNGRPGLGAGFLAAEAAFGATGLALLLTRTLRYNCVREEGFARGSVVCNPPEELIQELGDRGTENRVLAVRNAEQTFGLLFIGTLVVDVIIAQATFEKYSVVEEKEIPRAELEERMKQGQQKPSKRKKRGKKTSAKIRPTFGPGGAGLDIRF
jgi:hypothetical protein